MTITNTLRPVGIAPGFARQITKLRISRDRDQGEDNFGFRVDGFNEDTNQASEWVEAFPTFADAVASLPRFPAKAGVELRPRRTPTRADAIKTAAELWAGTSPEQMRGSEYLRGQVELIADLFGHDHEADPERESLAGAIITEAQK